MRLRLPPTRSLSLNGLQGDVVICHSVRQGLRPLSFTLADHQGVRSSEMSTRSEAHFVVWTGGVEADYYMTKEAADLTAQILKNDGYDDVVVEAVVIERVSD